LGLGFLQGGDHALGVEGGGWSKEREGRGFCRGLASGSSSSFDPTRYDKGKGVLKISWTLEKIPADPFFPLLVGLAKEIGERERDMASLGWLGQNLNSNLNLEKKF
jgi:hypothetical protein